MPARADVPAVSHRYELPAAFPSPTALDRRLVAVAICSRPTACMSPPRLLVLSPPAIILVREPRGVGVEAGGA